MNEIEKIDQFLLGKLSPRETLSYQVALLNNPGLRSRVQLQEKLHAVLRQYHRKKLRSEIEWVHTRIFNGMENRDFTLHITNLFNPQSK